MAVTVAGFAEMARIVRALADELCEGRVAAVLEGGYNVQALAQSVLATITMMSATRAGPEPGESWSMPHEASVAAAYKRWAPIDIGRVIDRVRAIHRL
jgi:acetoin utilization deacetylase AcuC-like enzyme